MFLVFGYHLWLMVLKVGYFFNDACSISTAAHQAQTANRIYDIGAE
jgi:hypothetical protein